VEFLSTPHNDRPEGQLLLNVQGIIAEYELEKIRERTSRGRREKARRGLIVSGTFAYGYRPDPAAPGRLVVQDDEAGIVRMMFRRLVEEQRSIRSIVIELRRLGTAPARGRAWAKSSVRNVLTNPVYTGRAFFNRREVIASPRTGRRGTGRRLRPESEWVPVAVPAIVTPELFEQARQQLERNRQTLAGRPGVRFYLLKCLLRCGACGRRLVGIPSHGRRVYRCAGRDRLSGAERCRAATKMAEGLDAFIWDTVVEILRNPALLSEKLEAHTARLGAREVEVRSEVEHLRRQLGEFGRQEQRLLDLYLDEQLAGPTIRTRLEALVRQEAGLEERRARAQQQAAAESATEAPGGDPTLLPSRPLWAGQPHARRTPAASARAHRRDRRARRRARDPWRAAGSVAASDVCTQPTTRGCWSARPATARRCSRGASARSCRRSPVTRSSRSRRSGPSPGSCRAGSAGDPPSVSRAPLHDVGLRTHRWR
jgi:site-specific DNA recombinase